MHELIGRTARELVDALRRKEVSHAEVLAALAARVEAVNPRVNAICVNLLDRAREDVRRRAGENVRALLETPLAGLPVLVKEFNDVAGVVTCKGCPALTGHVAPQSDLVVESLERNGGIVYGKSNVPEFAGAHTYNDVYGITRNPWNLERSVAGSSGGSAAALASGMAWLATGNDLGGSLRTPASFCAVVGLRPSPGRIARGPTDMPFDTLWVEGPMARNVGDAGLMLDAQAGFDRRDPISLPSDGGSYREAAENPARPARLAFTRDLGICAVDGEVADVCGRAVDRLANDGVEVVEASPRVDGAIETFHTLRAHLLAVLLAPTLEAHRAAIKPDIVWNVEKGLTQSCAQVAVAERRRSALIAEFDTFLDRHGFLVLPAAQTLPFAVEQTHPTEIAGRALQTYVDWIAITFVITLMACPVIVVPCGFSRDGLPVGMQIAAPRRHERELLRVAAHCERVWGAGAQVPRDPA